MTTFGVGQGFDTRTLRYMSDAITELQQTRFSRVPVFVSASETLFLFGSHTYVEGDTTGGNVTITLPDAEDVVEHEITVKKPAGANTLTIAATDIDGGTSIALTTQWSWWTLLATANGWRVVGGG